MKSLYKAKIFHKRFFPRVNKFAYSGFYMKFSLEKIKELDSLLFSVCLLYTSPSPRDATLSRMPSSA